MPWSLPMVRGIAYSRGFESEGGKMRITSRRLAGLPALTYRRKRSGFETVAFCGRYSQCAGWLRRIGWHGGAFGRVAERLLERFLEPSRGSQRTYVGRKACSLGNILGTECSTSVSLGA